MADEGHTFEQTKSRLEEILGEVKRKDTSLEKSIDLLEEGVRLANRCNELIDRAGWDEPAEDEAGAEDGGEPAETAETVSGATGGEDEEAPAEEPPAAGPGPAKGRRRKRGTSS